MSEQDKKSGEVVSEDTAAAVETGATQLSNVTPLRPTRPCPECGKPSHRDSYPFCSPRCRSVDLNRWLSDAYVIPGRPVDEEDSEQD